jgi:hypothetical protein
VGDRDGKRSVRGGEKRGKAKQEERFSSLPCVFTIKEPSSYILGDSCFWMWIVGQERRADVARCQWDPKTEC